MITAILCTLRPNPGFDEMMNSLAHTLALAPRVDFELIVVDGQLWYSADRRMQLDAAVKGRFPYRHVEPKPTNWQGPTRLTSRNWFDLNNARNTGLALARGTHIIFADDCSVVDPLWLTYHADAAELDVAVAGSFRSYMRASVINGAIISGDLYEHGDSRGEAEVLGATGGWLWGLNMSFPLHYALAVNGFDELYSGQGGSEDCDFGVRIERGGCRIMYRPACKIYQLLEHHQAVCGWQKKHDEVTIKQKERILNDGIPHYANEFLIQELLEDPGIVRARGNDFDLVALRTHVLATGAFPTTRSVTKDWRDGASLKDM